MLKIQLKAGFRKTIQISLIFLKKKIPKDIKKGSFTRRGPLSTSQLTQPR